MRNNEFKLPSVRLNTLANNSQQPSANDMLQGSGLSKIMNWQVLSNQKSVKQESIYERHVPVLSSPALFKYSYYQMKKDMLDFEFDGGD